MSQIQIPKEWELVKLGDYCNVVRGSSPRPKGDSRYFGGNIPWIKISDITASKGKYVFSTKEGLTPEGALKSRLLKSGTLILTTSMLIAMPKILKMNGCIHDGFLAILDVNKKINLDFLYYFFLGYRVKIEQENALGSAIKNINTEVIKNLDIAIPPLKTQQKIVQKLDYIFEQLEEKKKEILQRLNKFNSETIHIAYQNHLLNMAFSGKLTNEQIEHGKNDEIQSSIGWELTTLGNVIDLLYGKNLPKEKRNSGKFPVYGSNGIVGTHDQYVVDYQSIVVGRKGTVGAIHKTTEKFWPTDVCYYTKIKNVENLRLDFLFYLLSYLKLPKYRQSGPKSGLNRNDVYAIKFALPKPHVQEKIARILDSKFQEWEKYAQQITNIEKQYRNTRKSLENISSSILNAAFSGKLVN